MQLWGVPSNSISYKRRPCGTPLQAGEEDVAAAVAAGQLPRHRKAAARQKVLRSAAILQAAHSAKPVAAAVPRKPKGSVLAQQQAVKQAVKGGGTAVTRSKGKGAGAAAEQAAFDLWDAPQEQGDAWTEGLLPAKRLKHVTAPKRRAAAGAVVPSGVGPTREWRRPAVPAVEIDQAGCSYNPDVELHQEAVAVAVAAETRKLLDRVSGRGEQGAGGGTVKRHLDPRRLRGNPAASQLNLRPCAYAGAGACGPAAGGGLAA